MAPTPTVTASSQMTAIVAKSKVKYVLPVATTNIVTAHPRKDRQAVPQWTTCTIPTTQPGTQLWTASEGNTWPTKE